LPFELPVQPSKADIPSGQGIELARVAAGFWHTETSVLHGAMIAGVPAAGGKLVYPHVVSEIRRANGSRINMDRKRPRRVMSASSARHLRKMMARTTRIGTARRGFISRRGRPFLPDLKVGGKTGSLSRKSPYLHYNWFVGFAPADSPRVALAVLVGNPARWRIKAHTAARNLLAKYLESRKTKDEPPPVAARPAARAKAAQ
jgi:cell division protein FtsI/penicillin-binding protein 2